MQRSVVRPSVAGLGPPWQAALQRVCGTLLAGGHRPWLVGGAVRDLALSRAPKDMDLASAASPEEVEALFGRTVPVGKEFGTIVILDGDQELQHTTFRSESEYSDGRHPERVRFGSTLEGDAKRRDFTCNALYLDPLEDAFADPEGGLEDLRAGVLRCVGEPGERFREDGLRLMRMARFAARLDLEVAPEVLVAARAEAATLAQVSPERVLSELDRMFTAARFDRALELLATAELWPHVFRSSPWASDPAQAAFRVRWLQALAASDPTPPGTAAGLAVVLGPGEPAPDGSAELRSALDGLRVSRELRGAVGDLVGDLATLDHLRRPDPNSPGGGSDRAERVRLVRESRWTLAARLYRNRPAMAGEGSALRDHVAQLERFAQSLSDNDRFPIAWFGARELLAAGVEPGPDLGALLAEQEQLQLSGALPDRSAAEAWLATRIDAR